MENGSADGPQDWALLKYVSHTSYILWALYIDILLKDQQPLESRQRVL